MFLVLYFHFDFRLLTRVLLLPFNEVGFITSFRSGMEFDTKFKRAKRDARKGLFVLMKQHGVCQDDRNWLVEESGIISSIDENLSDASDQR